MDLELPSTPKKYEDYYNLAGKYSTSKKEIKNYLKKEIQFYRNLTKQNHNGKQKKHNHELEKQVA